MLYNIAHKLTLEVFIYCCTSNYIILYYAVYAQSQTIHSDYRHKRGVVLAKILRPNIPVKNGVVHLIESPLMIVDITVWKFLQNEKDGRLSYVFFHYLAINIINM